MARPKKNNADYFSHDADMRNNLKIKALRRKFRSVGYMVWCFLLEVMTDSDYFEIEWNELNIELMSGDFDVSADEIKDIVEYCIEIKLLQLERGKLFSRTHKKRFSSLLNKRERSQIYYAAGSEPIEGVDRCEVGLGDEGRGKARRPTARSRTSAVRSSAGSSDGSFKRRAVAASGAGDDDHGRPEPGFCREIEAGGLARQDMHMLQDDNCYKYEKTSDGIVSDVVNSVNDIVCEQKYRPSLLSNHLFRVTDAGIAESKVKNSRIKNSKLNLSLNAGVSQHEREIFFEIMVFEKQIFNPAKEVERFINHYAKTGWKDSNGNAVIDRVAALRNWKASSDAKSIPDDLCAVWKKFYAVVKEACPREHIMLLTELYGGSADEQFICVVVSRELYDLIENTTVKESVNPYYNTIFGKRKLRYLPVTPDNK